MTPTAKILLLGSGELGREFVISAKRLGAQVIACDSYAGAPAMQVADGFEVFSMLDGAALGAAIDKHKPDFVVPEVEAIRTEVLKEYEERGQKVVPSARATLMTMNRDRIRDVAANELGLPTSKFLYAESLEEMRAAVASVGIPCVVKPVMSSSGKGQSTVKAPADIDRAWDYAVAGMRGDRKRVIVEAFIAFDYEITLLTIRTRDGVLFCPPIGHRQERGDYQESWQPTPMSAKAIAEAQRQAKAVVDNLGGYGLFGVEFFIKDDAVIFSELSPRPHDTGMVTLISQNLTEFDLHARAILGLPIPGITQHGASASAVILADRDATDFAIEGLADALQSPAPGTDIDLRIFSKPTTRPYRRMGVALALVKDGDTDAARKAAKAAADKVKIRYNS
ncbi:MAG: formate-dependent phosphoribosylglycinamide formyltransferase [Ferrovibrio sp.]|uniref:formate-dependent phosphoribosylglycinamide formyltransferase n=1 Tax=Ferrovibrio sp. TaxID=1917215 RepID=UPI00263745E7|nr:formate-dependent phosphoribosylglycinamide formyltransferase [Ferrovibrio sp.]MCW0234773.1 formate-dependent phosphoribosylglycinamide formyltransferase [Ferrovibrio sp.]